MLQHAQSACEEPSRRRTHSVLISASEGSGGKAGPGQSVAKTYGDLGDETWGDCGGPHSRRVVACGDFGETYGGLGDEGSAL